MQSFLCPKSHYPIMLLWAATCKCSKAGVFHAILTALPTLHPSAYTTENTQPKTSLLLESPIFHYHGIWPGRPTLKVYITDVAHGKPGRGTALKTCPRAFLSRFLSEHSLDDLVTFISRHPTGKKCETRLCPLPSNNFIQFRGEQVLTENWDWSRQQQEQPWH